MEGVLLQGNCLVQVNTGFATFGLIVKDGIVVQAPPISHTSVGRPAVEVIRYYRQEKGADVHVFALGDSA
jgi:hypothetical protein